MTFLFYLTLSAVFSAAAFFDTVSGKIPNRVILFGCVSRILCYLFLSLYSSDLWSETPVPSAVTGVLAGLGIPAAAAPGHLAAAVLCVLLPLFWRFRLLGGGDVKLFWLLFLFLPGWPGVFCFVLAFLFAFPAALYSLFSGSGKLRMGGAVFLAVAVYCGMEVGYP